MVFTKYFRWPVDLQNNNGLNNGYTKMLTAAIYCQEFKKKPDDWWLMTFVFHINLQYYSITIRDLKKCQICWEAIKSGYRMWTICIYHQDYFQLGNWNTLSDDWLWQILSNDNLFYTNLLREFNLSLCKIEF